jgi:diguanylate cyclase
MQPRADVEIVIRGPQSYDLARRAIEAMERSQVWPTPLNFELWLHFTADPDGPLGTEMQRLMSQGGAITEDVSEHLAEQFLPKAKLNQQIRDAGDQLSKELESVASAISKAQKCSEAYGSTLTKAADHLETDVNQDSLRVVVDHLQAATKKVQKENATLEQRLAESTAEVTRLKEHLEQVRRDATTDALTNLANRKAFDEECEKAMSDSDDRGEALTLAVIDIDHFKSFNDTWGHQTGDQVIRFVASVIGRMAAPPRFAARYGGEEFAMIFPSENADQVFGVLEEIRVEISSRMLKRRSTNEDLGQITVSAGLAQRAKGETYDSLMERADDALYASKRGGRNQTSQAKAFAKAA